MERGLTSLLLRLVFMVLVCMPSAAAGQAPPILSACETDYPPFSIVDADGRADGFSVELLRAALKAMNRDVSFRTGTWNEVRGWLEQGEVEILPLVGRTPEREFLFDFTVPYMTLHGAIVVREETRDILSLEDLAGRRVAVMKGDNAEEFLRRSDSGMDIRTTTTFTEALQELSRGGCDAVVMQRLVALRLVRESGLENLRVLDRPVEGFRQDFCFAVKEGDRETLALLNEGLAIVVADGTYRHLHAKWFAALELPSNRRIVIGGDRNYPPFEFLDHKGRPAGYNVDLVRAIARELGLDMEIRLGLWAEIMKGLETGEIDMVQGMFYSPERDLRFDFSQPHSVNHYVSVVRRGERPPPGNIDELRGMRLIVQRGDVIHDFLMEKGLGGQITVAETQEDVLRELASGKYDCALVARISALYIIGKHNWQNLELGRHHFVSLDYCFAVTSGRKALLSQFNEGLKVLEESGEYRRIYDQWLGVYKENPPTLLVAIRYSVKVLVPMLLVILAAFLWSWSLRRQVAARTRELRESMERFRLLADSAPVGIVISDSHQKIVYVSKRFTRLYGYTLEDMPSVEAWWPLAYPDEVLRQRVQKIWSNDVEKVRDTGSEMKPMEFPVTCKDGAVRQTEFRLASTGELNFVILTDVTEYRKIEGQLRQAQKMEAVGRLAGGVAHDYNNMLGIIIGYTEIAMEKAAADDSLRACLEEVLKAANRSTEITRQLLAFARKQTISPKLLDLNTTIEGMLVMLRRLIGEETDLAWMPDTGLWKVKMDPSQVDQILVNLCINARDAMNGHGKITIGTDNVTFDEAHCAIRGDCIPGSFVLLAVSDDGCGMEKETRDNIFEPFFTTKGVNEGTGLGLATVYGIVKQNNGFINVYSEPGKGSTFKLYLPRHMGEGDAEEAVKATVTSRGKGETVLLVEDEPSLLELCREMLDMLGYAVLSAGTPKEAFRLAEEHAGAIQLLITDVVMPEMTGRELSGRLRALYPDLRVLFMSGYTANVIAHRGVLDDDVNFIQKPLTIKGLAAKLREVLD